MSAPIATKPLLLYTTPNGHQVAILLEELKAIEPRPSVDYDARKIVISTNEQKEPWFIKLNPNGRIPVLVDHSRNDFPVFETSAILLYLAQRYDKNFEFWFDPAKDPDNYSEMLQWLFFRFAVTAHFLKAAPEDIPYAKNRYVEETERLIGVLEIRLKDRDWFAGSGRGKYSIADIKAFPWIRFHAFVGIETLDAWPAVKSWIERSLARPAVQAGIKVPA